MRRKQYICRLFLECNRIKVCQFVKQTLLFKLMYTTKTKLYLLDRYRTGWHKVQRRVCGSYFIKRVPGRGECSAITRLTLKKTQFDDEAVFTYMQNTLAKWERVLKRFFILMERQPLMNKINPGGSRVRDAKQFDRSNINIRLWCARRHIKVIKGSPAMCLVQSQFATNVFTSFHRVIYSPRCH